MRVLGFVLFFSFFFTRSLSPPHLSHSHSLVPQSFSIPPPKVLSSCRSLNSQSFNNDQSGQLAVIWQLSRPQTAGVYKANKSVVVSGRKDQWSLYCPDCTIDHCGTFPRHCLARPSWPRSFPDQGNGTRVRLQTLIWPSRESGTERESLVVPIMGLKWLSLFVTVRDPWRGTDTRWTCFVWIRKWWGGISVRLLNSLTVHSVSLLLSPPWRSARGGRGVGWRA